VQYDPEADEKKEDEREQRKYNQIVQRFRVILPDEIERMLSKQTNNGLGANLKDGNKASMEQLDGRTPPKKNQNDNDKGHNRNDQDMTHTNGHGSMNVAVDAIVSNSKKRTLNEMLMQQPAGAEKAGVIDHLNIKMQNIGVGGADNNEVAQIEQLLHGLKKRVLDGETLHNFKKDISQISILIDKSEN